MTNQGDNLISAAEAAKMINVTSQTIRNWTKSGRLTPCLITPTGRYMYNREYIQKTIEDLSLKAKLGATSQEGEVMTDEQ